MSDEEGGSSGRAWISGVAVVALALVGGAASMMLFDQGVEPPTLPEPAPVPEPPRPSVTPSAPRPLAQPATKAERVSLDPPQNRVRPPKPDNPRPTPLTPDMRKEMNYFVDDILKSAQEACILPWLEASFEEPTRAEFVFDAVLYDGEMYDIGVRSLDHDLPSSVRSCIGDQAWGVAVPTLDMPGELRLQRTAIYRN